MDHALEIQLSVTLVVFVGSDGVASFALLKEYTEVIAFTDRVCGVDRPDRFEIPAFLRRGTD